MSKILIIANWKCNPTSMAEARRLFRATQKYSGRAKKVNIIICPPFVYLPLGRKLQAANYKLAAQDCFWEEKGAFTGEISAKMLKDLGCQYVIVGHSERRRYFSETDEQVNKKIKAAFLAKLKPILCVGETAQEKERGEVTAVLKRQIECGLRGLRTREVKNIVIAYEPVWAIGTGKNCSPQDAESVGLFIKKLISKRYSRVMADNLPILYGGSVNAQNAASYVREAGLQGLLVGGASLDAREFGKIVKDVEVPGKI